MSQTGRRTASAVRTRVAHGGRSRPIDMTRMLPDPKNSRNFPLSASQAMVSLNSALMKIDDTASAARTNIESHLKEKRLFKPPKGFSQNARIKNFAQYQRMYRESIRHPDKFWTREAN